MEKKNFAHTMQDPGLDTPADMQIYEEANHFSYLMYHKACRALMGKANLVNRFDEWEIICHNCKRIAPIREIRFAQVKKKI